MTRIITSLLLLVLLAGCASTKKRYERAQGHEQAGEWVLAAEAYLEVLEKDRAFEDTRDRLAEVGRRALDQLWATSEDLESTGAFALAIRELDRMEAISVQAARYDVDLPLPADFEDRRRFYVEAALDGMRRDAEQAVSEGRLEDAMRILERARADYELSEDDQFEFDHRLAEVLLNLARADIRQGRFKAGYDTALRAVEVLEPYDDLAEEDARRLADEALQAGIRGLALVPLWRTEAWQREAPGDLRADINDAIAFGEAGRRSEFIAIIEPGSTRRLVRAMGLDDRVLTRAAMRDLAQEIGADFVLAGELTGFTSNERVRRTRERETRIRGRGGADTTYTWQQIDIRLTAVAAYRVYDLETDEFVVEGTAEGESSLRVERGLYPGNWRSLDLSGTEQLLFDPEEWARQDRAMMIEVSDQLAERMMSRVEDRLERLID